ncbi:DUF58 domain-containing protein [Marinomonas sp. A79]|uniref:DUF58 domain-containing protein n=1 Tax=Marinomonas vulgaris TaxID=2823372 RepID=A0ABS5HDU4_9GAMM|nr:DUF58 domain-containing protein [Marinomonas vulgaris]MBR7889199.1 DUF58 domain-containing protein [Marinomonas vulgaris]
MNPLLAPSPELDDTHFALLAHYAKHLGRAPKAMRFAATTGERRSRQKGHGMEMLELRSYQASDDLRHIDWRVTARTGQAHTRLYAQENDHQRLLLMDLSPSAYFGTKHTFISTRFAQLAGLIAWRSKQQGDALSYRLTYGAQHQTSGNTQSLSVLLAQLKNATALSHRADKYTADSIWTGSPLIHHAHNKDVIILTDKQYWDDKEEAALWQLAKHNRVHWVQIIDSHAFNLPAGHYQMTSGFGIQRISVTESGIQQAKADFFASNARFKHRLSLLGIEHYVFDLNESPEKIARTLLAKGALR